ncbi:MAG: cysteine desulfurase [Spirochaetaceae bacterium]|jgi:cysteine desulfurase|nr:cysteine desulfurase [Spirochaetaceae bacterium]
MERFVYLDNQGSTRIDPRVLTAMLPYFTDHYGNPSNILSRYGRIAHEAIDRARQTLADYLGADSQNEIVFTSGATEANDLAVNGVIDALADASRLPHIITSRIEHAGILNTCKGLERRGIAVSYIGVDEQGLVSLPELRGAIREETVLISIMAANNEVGSIQPIAEIGEIARNAGILFHTDAAQYLSLGKLEVNRLHADLVSLSAHKIYGPKGIGALYIRQSVPLKGRIPGGMQQRGLRGGTLNTPGIAGFAEAVRLLAREHEEDARRIRALRDRLLSNLQRDLRIRVNGTLERRLPGNLNLAFLDTTAVALIALVPEIAVSVGSACSNAEPSHVLKAMGLPGDLVERSVRFSLGRFTTEAEIDYVSALLPQRLGRPPHAHDTAQEKKITE